MGFWFELCVHGNGNSYDGAGNDTTRHMVIHVALKLQPLPFFFFRPKNTVKKKNTHFSPLCERRVHTYLPGRHVLPRRATHGPSARSAVQPVLVT
jgi:hypothetical protein